MKLKCDQNGEPLDFFLIDEMNRRLPIYYMFDIDGSETFDPLLTCSVVAELPNGDWLASECRLEWIIIPDGFRGRVLS